MVCKINPIKRAGVCGSYAFVYICVGMCVCVYMQQPTFCCVYDPAHPSSSRLLRGDPADRRPAFVQPSRSGRRSHTYLVGSLDSCAKETKKASN